MVKIKVTGRNPKFVDNICEILGLFGYQAEAVDMGTDVQEVCWDSVKLVVFDVSNGCHTSGDMALIRYLCSFGIPVLVLGYPDDLGYYMHGLDNWPKVHYLKKMSSAMAFEKRLVQLVGSPSAN